MTWFFISDAACCATKCCAVVYGSCVLLQRLCTDMFSAYAITAQLSLIRCSCFVGMTLWHNLLECSFQNDIDIMVTLSMLPSGLSEVIPISASSVAALNASAAENSPPVSG